MSIFRKIRDLIRVSSKEEVEDKLDPQHFNLFDLGTEIAQSYKEEASTQSLIYRTQIDDLLKTLYTVIRPTKIKEYSRSVFEECYSVF